MTRDSISRPTLLRSSLPYVLPFLLFGLLTLTAPLAPWSKAVVYALKTILVGGSLLFFWKTYRDEIRITFDGLAILGGVLVFFLWIGLEGSYPLLGGPAGFNPESLEPGFSAAALIALRLGGSVLIVPIMEELFWRSFALRFLMDTDFKLVSLGSFSWFSFILVSVAFGLEHHRWLPGLAAGAVYALALYRTRNLFSPILSHVVTNALLGAYVLSSGSWSFW